MIQLDNIQESEFSIGQIDKVSWVAPAGMTFEQWQEFGNTLQTVQGSINWWIGDWLNEGERRYGETYAQAVEVTGWDYAKLSMVKRVSERVPLSNRFESASWTHHYSVAHLPPDGQEHWLNRAINGKWSSRQLKEELKAHQQKAIQQSNGYHKPTEPTPSDYDEPAEYLAALWSADGDGGDIPDDRQWQFGNGEKIYSTAPNPPVMQSQSGKNLDALMSSDSVEWYTTPDIITAVIDVMGAIDLDPCSNSKDNPNIPALKHYTKEDDGLSYEWEGRVYVNPPYGNAIPDWVQKIVQEHKKGNIAQCILLVPARTDTRWFRALKEYPRCFMHGRVRFNNHENSAPFPTMLVGIGVDDARFIEVMENLGDVYQWVTNSASSSK